MGKKLCHIPRKANNIETYNAGTGPHFAENAVKECG